MCMHQLPEVARRSSRCERCSGSGACKEYLAFQPFEKVYWDMWLETVLFEGDSAFQEILNCYQKCMQTLATLICPYRFHEAFAETVRRVWYDDSEKGPLFHQPFKPSC